MPSSAALLTGLALDAWLGDPPNRAHPVAWFGRAADALDRRAPRSRVAGAAATVALVVGTVLPIRGSRGRVPRVALDAVALWLCLSRRPLLERARQVARALEAGELPEARRLLAYHLVSRDTSDLSASEVAGATIESVAENLSDAVVAPCWWYAIAGTEGAVAYRALNTLDGMWGYRTPRYEAFGWAAARGDDVANLVPARLTALAVVLASGERATEALRAWGHDRGQTDSPNAGHPMAAMAGALRVALRKRGQYAMNEGGREPSSSDVLRAVALADRASLIAIGLLAVVMWSRR